MLYSIVGQDPCDSAIKYQKHRTLDLRLLNQQIDNRGELIERTNRIATFSHNF